MKTTILLIFVNFTSLPPNIDLFVYRPKETWTIRMSWLTSHSARVHVEMPVDSCWDWTTKKMERHFWRITLNNLTIMADMDMIQTTSQMRLNVNTGDRIFKSLENDRRAE